MANAKVATHQNGNGPARDGERELRLFSAEEIQGKLGLYRQGIMELKAQRDALQAQLDDLDKRIARTEGAALGMANLLQEDKAEA